MTNLKTYADDLISIRTIFTKLIKKFTVEQLNEIPKGFNNNLIWNFTHCIATQQILCYKLSNNPLNIPNEMCNNYKNGTVPTFDVDEIFVEEVSELLLSTAIKFRDHVEYLNFYNFTTFEPTTFKITIRNIKDAIRFNNMHEFLHLGYMLSISKFLLKKKTS